MRTFPRLYRMTQDTAIQSSEPRLFHHVLELTLNPVKQQIEEFINIHLNVDINRMALEIDDGVRQFLRKSSLVIPQLKSSE